MSNIYDQHRAAFANVSAYVVTKGGERVATIAFKYPRDGAGRLFAYVHFLGSEMVRGYAAGGGYDKHSAACASAARKFSNGLKKASPAPDEGAHAFWPALAKDAGYDWSRELRDAGFEVWQAV